MATDEKRRRPLELEDLLKVEYLSAPAADAARGRAWYVVSRAVRATGEFSSEVWEAALDGGGAAPVLPGAGFSQKLPRPGADGVLYLLSDEAEPGVFQVWRLRGGAREQVTHLRHGVRWYALSADGRTLAFEAPLWPEELAAGLELCELTGPERAAWERARARRPVEVEDLMYKLDSEHGLLDGSVAQVGVVDLSSGEERLLTRGTAPHEKPVPAPDGARVACWSRPYGGWRALSGELALIEVATGAEALVTRRDPDAPDEAETGDPMPAQAITDEPPFWLGPNELAWCVYAQDAEGGLRGAILHARAAAGAAPEDLLAPTPGACFGPGAMATSHTAYGYAGEALKAGADGALYLLSAARSVAGVWPVDARGAGAGARLTPDGVCVQGFAAAGPGTLVLVMGAPDHIAEPYALDLASGVLTRLAHHNAWLDEVDFPVPEEFVVESPAGDGAPIHGWVLRPRGAASDASASTPAPVVLDIHGGPECYIPYDWWFEFQYLAARGFAVAWCDPHGSISYGGAFQQGAWDGAAKDDLLAFLDAACAQGGIDPARAGVTGGSYGGYMTNVMIGTTDRFAAAVSQRNLCNRAISYGTGDMGALGTGPGEPVLTGLMERLKSGSTTIKDVDRISAPTLVLHATSDYRCGFEQADQLYHALKDRRPEVPARLAAFPGENHGLTREGNAWAQVGHLREMAAWFERHLMAGDAAEGANAAEPRDAAEGAPGAGPAAAAEGEE